MNLRHTTITVTKDLAPHNAAVSELANETPPDALH